MEDAPETAGEHSGRDKIQCAMLLMYVVPTQALSICSYLNQHVPVCAGTHPARKERSRHLASRALRSDGNGRFTTAWTTRGKSKPFGQSFDTWIGFTGILRR